MPSSRQPILPDPKTGKFTMGAGTAPIVSAAPVVNNRGYPSLTQTLAATTPVGAIPTKSTTSVNTPAINKPNPITPIDFNKITPLPQTVTPQRATSNYENLPVYKGPADYGLDPNVTAQQTDPMSSALQDLLLQMLAGGGSNFAPVGAINVPDLPRTDISGLYNQFSPSINQAFDALTSQLTGARSEQNRGFADLIGRVQASYAPARQDVTGATSQAASAVQDLANRFGLGSTTQGQMGQRWAETGGRLEGLAAQNQAAQLGSLDTLRNARDSMYNTFLAQAQGGRAGGLAELASQIASGQSNIDAARSQAQGSLAEAALSGQLNLAQLQQSQQNNELDRQLKILGLLSDLQASSAANMSVVEETTTQRNPGILGNLATIQDPDVRNMVQQAWYSTESPDEAIRNLYAMITARAPKLINEETGQVRGIGERPGNTFYQDREAQLQQAIDYLRPYSEYGGIDRTIKMTRSSPKPKR